MDADAMDVDLMTKNKATQNPKDDGENDESNDESNDYNDEDGEEFEDGDDDDEEEEEDGDSEDGDEDGYEYGDDDGDAPCGYDDDGCCHPHDALHDHHCTSDEDSSCSFDAPQVQEIIPAEGTFPIHVTRLSKIRNWQPFQLMGCTEDQHNVTVHEKGGILKIEVDRRVVFQKQTGFKSGVNYDIVKDATSKWFIWPLAVEGSLF